MEFESPTGYKTPGLTVDAVLLKGDEVMLIRRAQDPGKGQWALPGGFVEVGETTDAACMRELLEETGLLADPLDLLGVYDDPGRDPRGHIVSVVYVCKVRGVAPGLDDAAERAAEVSESKWFALSDLPDLAFDHARILADAQAWLAAGGAEVLAGSE